MVGYQKLLLSLGLLAQLCIPAFAQSVSTNPIHEGFISYVESIPYLINDETQWQWVGKGLPLKSEIYLLEEEEDHEFDTAAGLQNKYGICLYKNRAKGILMAGILGFQTPTRPRCYYPDGEIIRAKDSFFALKSAPENVIYLAAHMHTKKDFFSGNIGDFCITQYDLSRQCWPVLKNPFEAGTLINIGQATLDVSLLVSPPEEVPTHREPRPRSDRSEQLKLNLWGYCILAGVLMVGRIIFDF